MDPRRKRRIRLTVLLSVVVLLAGALVYTSFSAATDATTPSAVLASGATGKRVELTGKVVHGSVSQAGDRLKFRIRDRHGTDSVPVSYAGAVPDPFREGREVIIKGTMRDGVFVAQRDSLVTKCPSKFKKEHST